MAPRRLGTFDRNRLSVLDRSTWIDMVRAPKKAFETPQRPIPGRKWPSFPLPRDVDHTWNLGPAKKVKPPPQSSWMCLGLKENSNSRHHWTRIPIPEEEFHVRWVCCCILVRSLVLGYMLCLKSCNAGH